MLKKIYLILIIIGISCFVTIVPLSATDEINIESTYDSGTYYNQIHDLKLISDKENINIYYTTNGSTPNESSKLYNQSKSIMIHQNTTLKFIGYNVTNSSQASQVYTFDFIIDENSTITPNLVAGTYYNQIHNLRVSSSSGGVIYYTTDGSTPNNQSNLYDGDVIMIHHSQSLKFISYDKKGVGSQIYSYQYIIDENPNITPNIKPGTYYSEIHTLKVSSSSNGTIYYTTDGSAPTNKSKKYDGKVIMVHHSQILKFILYSDTSNSKVFTYNYTINKSPVTANPSSKKINKNFKVSLSIKGNGKIYYKLNNDAYKLYSKPIKITKSSKLNFYGKDSLGHDSNVLTKKYVIDKVVPKIKSSSPKSYGKLKGKNVVIAYSEKIDKVNSKSLSKITLINAKNKKKVSIDVKILNNKLIISPKAKLKPNIKYYIVIPKKTIKDIAGNIFSPLKQYKLTFKV